MKSQRSENLNWGFHMGQWLPVLYQIFYLHKFGKRILALYLTPVLNVAQEKIICITIYLHTVNKQRIRKVNKFDHRCILASTHPSSLYRMDGMELFPYLLQCPWKHIIGNYFGDGAWEFTTFRVKSKFFCGNGMLKETTLDTILCNDRHAIKPFSNPSDLYCQPF